MSLIALCGFCSASNSSYLAHCKPCYDVLKGRMKMRTQQVKNLKHHYLWSWRKNQDFLSFSLSKAIKNRPYKDAFYHQLVSHVDLKVFKNQSYFVIWVPSQAHPNHSLGLARALALQLKACVSGDIGLKKVSGPQKRSSLSDRGEVEFLVDQTIKKSIAQTLEASADLKVLLVDDVLTTGFTAYRIIQALDLDPSRCEVFTPIFRQK